MKETGLSEAEIIYIPTGVDVDELNNLKLDSNVLHKYGLSSRIVLYVGRITEQKGLATLVSAGAALIKEGALGACEYVIVGYSSKLVTPGIWLPK